ncbi:hypothetical protein J4E91_009566 [Alternaria rosae]|nr:hypothetical protein J4E91_009566 [Alternaria rosae]
MDNSDDFIEISHVPDLVDITPSQFEKAKSTMVHYEKADKVRDELAQYVFPEVTPKEFEAGVMDKQAKPLINKAYENYPLFGYANGVKKVIMDAVAGEIAAKNIKKTAQRPVVDLSLASRLELLKPQAVQAVAAALFARLHLINKQENRNAEKDPSKAAAQHRIILPDVEESTVRTLMQWMYQNTFPLLGTEQTYAVMKLAQQIGVDALAVQCRKALYNVTNASLRSADADGISFQALLGYGSEAVKDDIVRVVFKHAIKDESTPKELKSLIIDSLAGYLDPDLWHHVKGLISHRTALQIIEAMVNLRQLVKIEMDGQDSIKSESQDASSTDVSEIMAIDEDKKPVHVKEQDEAQI